MRSKVLAEIAKNGALALPLATRLNERRRLRRGYGLDKNTPAYPRGVFETHRKAVESIRPVSGRVLEIGHGGNVAVAALFVAAGAEDATCVDLYPWVRTDSQLYEALGVAEFLDRVSYVHPCTAEDATFESGSFDIIYSHAAFEHFRRPADAVRNIARMLAPGGVTSHQVDLRDHLDFARPLDFLRHSDLTMRLMSSHRLWWTNRWRASDIVDAFTEAGLTIVSARPTESISVSESEAAGFAEPFRAKTAEDLGVLGLHITAQKPS